MGSLRALSSTESTAGSRVVMLVLVGTMRRCGCCEDDDDYNKDAGPSPRTFPDE